MKLLASDLDLTLLFKNENGKVYIKDEDIKAIADFQNSGNLFGVSTGRGIHTASGEVIGNIRADFYVVNSGGAIYDRDLNIIEENALLKPRVLELYAELTRKDDIIIYCKNDTYALRFVDRDLKGKKLVNSIDEINDEIYSISLKLWDEACARAEAERLKDKWGEEFAVFQNQVYVDICKIGCSKGAAVLKAAHILGVKEGDISVIGDSYNDISMFEAVENSYTFDYSDEEVKKKTKRTVKSVAECIYDIMNS